MKRLFSILYILIGVAAAISAQNTTADSQEKELAKVPLNNYLQGQITGDPEFIRKAFHKDARIMAFRDGKLTNLSVEEFATRFNGKAAEDEAKRKRIIESLDISGNAAIAKIVLDYPTIKFVDYMSLLKIDGEWKIVNKSFHAQLFNETEKVSFKSAEVERKAVEMTLNTFIQAGKTGNLELMTKVLQPEGNQKYVENSKYSSKTYSEFLIEFAKVRKGKPAKDDAQRKRTIESIDISGNSATAKVIADYPDTKYFEYVVLLKIDDEWKIVNNIFHGEPKEQPKK